MRGASFAGAVLLIVACSGTTATIGGGTGDGGASSSSGGSSGGGSSGGGSGGSSGSSSGGSSGGGSGSGSGGGSGGSSGSSSGGIVDASTDGPTACKLSPPDGGACNSLVPPASAVTVQCDLTAPVPTPLGGPIRDGTYVMVSSTYYGNNSGAACPAEVDNTMWHICGSSWQTAQVSTVTGTPPYTLIGDVTVVATGTALALTVTCGITPPPPPFTFAYDASGNALRLHINGTATAGRIDTFQRQ